MTQLPRGGSQPYDVLALTVITKSLSYLQTPADQLLDAKLILCPPSIFSSSLSGSIYLLRPIPSAPQWAVTSIPSLTEPWHPPPLLRGSLRSRELSARMEEQVWDKNLARMPPSGTLMTPFSLSTTCFIHST